MQHLLGILAIYAFILGLGRVAHQVRSICRWVIDRVRHP